MLQDLEPSIKDLELTGDPQGPFFNWNLMRLYTEKGKKFPSEKGLIVYREKNVDNNKWKGKGSNTTLKKISIEKSPFESKLEWCRYGKKRFDTLLVRNLTWFTQLQRVVRWYLTQALRGRPHPLVYNEQVGQVNNTEYYNNQVFDINKYEPFWKSNAI